ncbi:type I polyketide synthase [Streptomyces sp. NPDC059134]|uniref:type I polyketide synthase n=1 Tax=Streptomyces sp. NPDC059134 TaxID=3346738 RepID=UPI00368AA219
MSETRDPETGNDAFRCAPVAIIGMSCRYPGAPGVADFWNLISGGGDAITGTPGDRYDTEASSHGQDVPKLGGFISGVDRFDADFFGISPREARLMDPQQRLLLEVGYEALEDGGRPPPRLAGQHVGVFVGQIGNDYWHLQQAGEEKVEFYGLTGASSRAISSNRLSFAFDLRGPSITVDTACASSLTAVHLAVQSLTSQECDLALVGAANLILTPGDGVAYLDAGMLAGDGRCKFGARAADGFVRSDGIGALLLKPLDRAVRDGDRVRAVIRGSAVGNDGRTSGYLATPAYEGQRAVLERACLTAGADPARIDFVEAHGTGTSSGDPVELSSLAAVLGRNRHPDRLCYVGSVKTNIGHTEAAAGIAGLIKATLALENGLVPPSLHSGEPNPEVAWEAIPLRIPTRPVRLARRSEGTWAGVNSFGIGGTNAHVVLSSAPGRTVAPAPDGTAGAQDPPHLLTLSAASGNGLRDLARAYVGFLAPDGPGRASSFRDICFSASACREHRENRLAVVATTHDEAREALSGFLDGDTAGLSTADDVEEPTARIAFVFPGQGSQWASMGRDLYASEPVFRTALDACDAAVLAEAGWSLVDVLYGSDEKELTAPDVVQPTLWAMEVALAALWRSWGIEPDVVIGHSMGEAAAAYVSGALPLADCAAVICRRSSLAARTSGQGAMAWVELGAAEVEEALDEDEVSVAAANSPTSTLLSGERGPLDQVLKRFDARDVFHRWVKVDYASHGSQMEPVREALLTSLSDVVPHSGRLPVISTLLTEPIDGSQMDAGYWARNIREPVDFVGAVRQALREETLFVEISPHPLLTEAVAETADDAGGGTLAVGSLRRGESGRGSLLRSLGSLYTAGARVDWEAVTAGGSYVPLPHYPWQRDSFWLTPAATGASTSDGAPAPRGTDGGATRRSHPLLAERIRPDGEDTYAWRSSLNLSAPDHAYLRGHRVEGTVILPGTAYVEIASAVGREIFSTTTPVHDIAYHRALFLEDGDEVELRVTAEPVGTDAYRVRVLGRGSGEREWTLHGEATATASDEPAESGGPSPGAGDADSLDQVRRRCTRHRSGDDFYAAHARTGNEWRGVFRGLQDVWTAPGESLGFIECPEGLLAELDAYVFHPALLDAAGQCLLSARPPVPDGQDELIVAGSADSATLLRPPTGRLWTHARALPSTRGDSFRGDITIYDEHGRLTAVLRGFRLQYLLGAAPHGPVEETPYDRKEGTSDDRP